MSANVNDTPVTARTLLLCAALGVACISSSSRGQTDYSTPVRGFDSRAKAFASQLSIYQTDHYTIHFDVDSSLARDIAQRMDAMYEEYARRLNAFGTPQRERYDVYLFTRRIDYMKFIDDRAPTSGGVFIPNRNVLAAFLEGQGRDAMRRTLQHEAFHQFAHCVISENLPPWINEGMAQLFEEGIWTGEKFIVEQVPPRRLRQLQADIKADRLTDFKDFVQLDHSEWARSMRDRDRGAAQYNQAWAMVHFLVYARDRNGDPLYRQLFFEMLRSIHEGMSADDAFVKHFGTNYAGFEKRFFQYTSQLTPSKEATYVENVEVLADMMLELRDDEKLQFRSFADFRRHVERGGYQLHYTKGQLRWSSNEDVRVYFKDLDGRDLPGSQLCFQPNGNAALPDLICRPASNLEYRASFYAGPSGKVEREVTVSGY
ncbi:MAG: DUF1570 domain-containing protein [Tepidisphaeraceae bacterium]